MPWDLLLKHYSMNNGFNFVHPRDLLATIMANASPVTIVDGRTLKKARDKALTFDTSTPLYVRFAEAKRAMEQLVTLHGVLSSKDKLMMLWLGDLEREKEFEDEIEDWKKR